MHTWARLLFLRELFITTALEIFKKLHLSDLIKKFQLMSYEKIYMLEMLPKYVLLYVVFYID